VDTLPEGEAQHGRERTTVTDYEMFSVIVRRLDFEQITQRMVSAFRTGISGYRRLPEVLIEGQIVDVIGHNIEVFRSTTLAGREPTDVELEPFRESARERASEGMPLEDLLHAYRLGGRLSWQALVEIADPEERDGLLAGADILMRYIDVVSATVAQAYLDARQHVVSEEERRLRALLQAICEDDGPLTPETSSLASRVGIPVAARYRPFALAVAGEGAIRHGQMAAELRKQGILALTEGDRVSGLLADAQELHAHPDTLVAVDAPAPRGALTIALERVRMIVDLGRRLDRTGRLTADDIALEMMLADSPDAAGSLAVRVLVPLRSASGRRASLERTLRTFIAAEMDRRATAAELHIHPNTLDYRLRRFEALTSLRLTDPRDLTVVVLALSHAGESG
jgi:PucR C-terminal helix-turn-helix domain